MRLDCADQGLILNQELLLRLLGPNLKTSESSPNQDRFKCIRLFSKSPNQPQEMFSEEFRILEMF